MLRIIRHFTVLFTHSIVYTPPTRDFTPRNLLLSNPVDSLQLEWIANSLEPLDGNRCYRPDRRAVHHVQNRRAVITHVLNTIGEILAESNS